MASTWALARPRLALGLSPSLLVSLRSRPVAIHYHLLSTSVRSQAELHPDPSHNVPPALGNRGLGTKDEPENVNPYKGGPSAIDKAVHIFFFTEILRGIFICVVEAQLSCEA